MERLAPREITLVGRLVYWSAFVPEDGRPLQRELPTDFADPFPQLAHALGNHTVMLPFDISLPPDEPGWSPDSRTDSR